MKPIVTINWDIAPKDWKSFQKWHALACAASDPLSAEERWETKHPKEVKGDNPGTKGTK